MKSLIFDTIPCILSSLSVSLIMAITFHYIALLHDTAFYNEVAFAINIYFGLTFYLNIGLAMGLTAAASQAIGAEKNDLAQRYFF
mmetsp:Transcript_23011/g.19973  ORF Transcript_23011/g.19973 Transcript_23011/m.19973 type:complete len:85 (+) Transcript_23011:122-376(+)